jgi:hypothetical protein
MTGPIGNTAPNEARGMRRRRLLELALVGSLALVSVLILWTALDDWRFQTAATVLIAVLALVLVLDPEVLRVIPVESVKLPLGLEFGLPAAGSDEEEERDTSSDAARGDLEQRWLDVRWKFEYKLAYLAKHTLPDHVPYLDERRRDAPGAARSFANIGSLHHDGYLEPDAARVATLVLALSPTDLNLTKRDELEKLLTTAEQLARVIRARVFQGLVAQYIRRRGWTLENMAGLRWTVRASPDRQLLVVPVFGTSQGFADKHVARLARETAMRSLVVVPNPPGGGGALRLPDKESSDPAVVRFSQIEDAVRALGAG